MYDLAWASMLQYYHLDLDGDLIHDSCLFIAVWSPTTDMWSSVHRQPLERYHSFQIVQCAGERPLDSITLFHMTMMLLHHLYGVLKVQRIGSHETVSVFQNKKYKLCWWEILYYLI